MRMINLIHSGKLLFCGGLLDFSPELLTQGKPTFARISRFSRFRGCFLENLPSWRLWRV